MNSACRAVLSTVTLGANSASCALIRRTEVRLADKGWQSGFLLTPSQHLNVVDAHPLTFNAPGVPENSACSSTTSLTRKTRSALGSRQPEDICAHTADKNRDPRQLTSDGRRRVCGREVIKERTVARARKLRTSAGRASAVRTLSRVHASQKPVDARPGNKSKSRIIYVPRATIKHA
jgi:hypothetical protein